MFGKVSTLVMMFFLFYFFFFTVSILLSWSGTLSKFSQSFANITNFNNGTCVTLYLIQGFSHWLLNALPLQIISTQDWRSCFFKIILFTTQIWKRLWRYMLTVGNLKWCSAISWSLTRCRPPPTFLTLWRWNDCS